MTTILSSLEDFDEQFVEVSEMGRGRFGVVYEARSREDQQQVFAAKHIRTRRREIRTRALEEARLLFDLRHSHILRMEAVFGSDQELILVTELLTGGELFGRLASDNFELTEKHCVNYIRQMCLALAYIHSKNVVHLDLKPENVVFVSSCSEQIKVIDFGLARRLQEGNLTRSMCGTPEFMAPETVNYDNITCATDIWSLGVMTYVLLSGLSPFRGETHLETLSNVSRGEFDFNASEFDVVSDQAKAFIAKLLQKRPENRISAQICLQHPWLKDDEMHEIQVLNKANLKIFLARRRWLKCGQVVLAMTRMSGLMRRRSSQTSDLCGSFQDKIRTNLGRKDENDYDDKEEEEQIEDEERNLENVT